MDTFMLSQVSDESVAAVGLANQIITFCFLVFEIINLGTSVLCSQYIGARLPKKMETAAGVALTLNLVIGVAVSAFLFYFAYPLLNAMGLEGSALRQGASYMRIVSSLAFVQAVALTLSAVLRANNKAYYPMLVILVVNILNITGNYILIFGKFGAPALGSDGAAYVTAGARVIAMLALGVITFSTTISRFPLHIFSKWPSQEFKNLMKVGLPSAGEALSYNCSQLVLSYFITMLGLEALAARTYCVNLIMFVYLFCIAISHGGAISIGHLVGKSKNYGAYVLGIYIMKIAAITTFCISAGVACAGPWIFSLLTDNPVIIGLGTAILWIDVVLEIGRPINIFAVNALQAAGDVNYPFYVGLIFMWIVAVAGAYLVGITFGLGLLGIWWMFTLDENLRAIVFIRRWNSLKWQNKGFVLSEAQAAPV